MAKLLMIGEEHSSKKLQNVGTAIEEKMSDKKRKNFIVLVEGPFLTIRERISLHTNIMFTPTAEFLRILRRMHNKGFDRMLAREEKIYLRQRGLEKFRINVENIESSAFLFLPMVLKIGRLEKIGDFERETLEAFSRQMKAAVYAWKDDAFNESMILAEYIDALDLTIKLRTSLNYTEDSLPAVNILDMSEDGRENKKIFSKFPPDMYEDILQLLSKISFALRSRSILHAEKISAVAERKMHDTIVAVTGAGHVPDVIEILGRSRLFDEREVVFSENNHEGYSRQIRDPDVVISYL